MRLPVPAFILIIALLLMLSAPALAGPTLELGLHQSSAPEGPPGRGFHLRYQDRWEALTYLLDLVGEARGAERGLSLDCAFYWDFTPQAFLYLGGGLGFGDPLFPKNHVYAELNWKFPLYRQLVLAAGGGRNGYRTGADLQTGLGLTLYLPAGTLYYRWFRFWKEESFVDNHVAQLTFRLERGELDLGVVGAPGGGSYKLGYRHSWGAVRAGLALELHRPEERLRLELSCAISL